MHLGFMFLFGCFCDGNSCAQRRSFSRCSCGTVEDLISGLFLPLSSASNGLKTDAFTIRGLQSRSLFALALRFLMNSKGLVELIVLNIDKREENSVKDSMQAVVSNQHELFNFI
ncbi:hypothetical protein PVL29_024740 [Vitis rotundifolia]|uniref:Secreted protein n=1 Tax=Vitis rotundifolia TaxID=103349 RepID=A0AA38YSZ9_VITRO|nr:hypothetical protein PVL29_024740 [Vitis rotundifolia]